MAETHVISALRTKRAEIAAHIHDTEKKLAKLRASAANLDAAIDLLTPDHPDAVQVRRAYRKTRYFANKELPRVTRDALRNASGPLTASEIAATAIKAKGLPDSSHEAVKEHILLILRNLLRKGEVTKSGISRNAQWALASTL